MSGKSEKKAEVPPPEGLVYGMEFISIEEENELVEQFKELPFKEFLYQGYRAKRRVLTFGYAYDFTTNEFSKTTPIPDFLLPFRDRAAAFASMPPGKLKEALLTEYTPGTPIGWHRDLPMFDTILGISLSSSCIMRFKPYKKEGDVFSIELEPRSIYIMKGKARWSYQHSIPPVKSLRYSITFRSFRSDIDKDL